MKPLGKPVNNLVKSCEDVTAACVIWDGPNISVDCLGVQICEGDSIVPILYNTVKKFCMLVEKTDLSSIDSTCIIELGSPPDTFVELFNLINEKLCDNEIRIKKEELVIETEYSANLPYCLQIKEDTVTITRLPLDDYMSRVASKVCEELQLIDILDAQLNPNLNPQPQIYQELDDLTTEINAQCSQTQSEVMEYCTSPLSVRIVSASEILPPVLPTFVEYVTAAPHNLAAGDLIYIQGISPDIYNFQMAPVYSVTSPTSFLMEPVVNPHSPGPIPPANLSSAAYVVPVNSVQIEDAYERLEKAFCSFKNFTGTPADLLTAVARDCPDLSTLPALSNNGPMSSIYGWINYPSNLAQSVNNLWLTICDMRSAIRNILITCCEDTPCLSFDIGYRLAFDPANQYVDIFFQDTYPGPTPVVPPGPPPTLYLSTIRSLDRVFSYTSGAVPTWLNQLGTSDFINISTVKVTLSDGSGTYTQDTGLTMIQLMDDAITINSPYRFNYPALYDPTAPVKTINIEFDYSYVFKIVAVNTSVPGKITYTTATRHYFQIGNRVNVTNTTPANYSFTDQVVTGVPSAYEFTVNIPSIGFPAYVSGGNTVQNTANFSCETCGCCCTFSLTNGLY